MGSIKEPKNESDKVTLSRIKKKNGAAPHHQIREKGGGNQTRLAVAAS
jgi:hypothetical protein